MRHNRRSIYVRVAASTRAITARAGLRRRLVARDL